MSKKKPSVYFVVLALLSLLATWYLNKNPQHKEKVEKVVRFFGDAAESTVREADAKSGNPIFTKEVEKLLTEAKSDANIFDLLENCTLLEHRWNDGDSFHVQHGRQKTHFRLYFVDTPESAYKTYQNNQNNGKRLDEQGDYFGGLNRKKTAALGKEATNFTLDLLKKKPFKVVTKWQKVTNRHSEFRMHAFIIVEYKGKDRYLHELLMAKGLARLKTRGTSLPKGRSTKEQKNHLKKIETFAKKYNLGGWK